MRSKRGIVALLRLNGGVGICTTCWNTPPTCEWPSASSSLSDCRRAIKRATEETSLTRSPISYCGLGKQEVKKIKLTLVDVCSFTLRIELR